MTITETYRLVFNAPGGKDVLADLASQVEQMPSEHSGSAGKLLAHITKKLHEADRPTPRSRPDRLKASGGRIHHG